MPRKDLTGQQFGRLKVIKIDEEKTQQKKQSYWICECECGNIKSIFGSSLTTGRTKSCGCLQKDKVSINISGQRFGKLVALYKTTSQIEKNGTTKTRWHCRCDCGNECDVLTESLRKGDTKSCGCLFQEYQDSRAEDLTGKRFGKLLVLEKDTNFSQLKKRTYWRCKCDCGNIKSIYHTHLISGDTKSCGCLISKGEEYISYFLKENNIQYISQYYFEDLYGIGGGHLRFDFAILKNNQIYGVIEYNGIQHYQAVDCWGGKEALKKQQLQDERKREYCEKNNILLLTLSYQLKQDELERELKEWLKRDIWTQKE